MIAALAVMISAVWLIKRPHWGVLIILGSWFLELKMLSGLSYVVSGTLLIPLSLSILRDRAIWVLRVPQIQIFLVLGVLFFVSTWWSDFKYPITMYPKKDQTIREVREFVTHLAWFVFFLYFIRTRKALQATVWVAVGLIVAAALSAVVPFLETGGQDRAAANFSLANNSNRLAYICLFATTFVWFYRSYASSGRWEKLLTLPLLGILPVGALMAGSRSGLLQMVALAAVIIKDQKGWSVAKRLYCFFLMGLVGLLILAAVPSAYIERATTFDPAVEAPGQESLQNRLRVVLSALSMIGSDPIFGAGMGNLPWVAPAFYGASGSTHNSYLWALAGGGIGVLALYLLLFYVTFRMVKRLERYGPRDLLWVSKALKTNLILFLIFSAFADMWLSDFLYLLVALIAAMHCFWQRQEQTLAWTPHRANAVA